ncbi:MAG: hypothetical protein ABI778_10500 [Ignavibacteriota bacterium]
MNTPKTATEKTIAAILRDYTMPQEQKDYIAKYGSIQWTYNGPNYPKFEIYVPPILQGAVSLTGRMSESEKLLVSLFEDELQGIDDFSHMADALADQIFTITQAYAKRIIPVEFEVVPEPKLLPISKQ